MSSELRVHVVSKTDNSVHSALPTRDLQGPLADGAVRVRPALLTLTANNLSYARGGGAPLYWWDTYPVPKDLEAPYSNEEQFGIVPAWGYGKVKSSKVKNIEPGRLMWGFWPMSNATVDLKLVPADCEGHYKEISEHRKRLFNSYQRYKVLEPTADLETMLETMAWEAIIRPVGEAGFIINRYILGEDPIHPMNNGEWTSQQADVRSAVVVTLGASGKTARSFHDALINDRPSDDKPLGLMAVTTSADQGLLPKASFPTRVTRYSDLTSKQAVDWLKGLKPAKALVVDFGSRGESLKTINGTLKAMLGESAVTIIGVGGEAKVYTKEEVLAYLQRNVQLENRAQLNTTVVRDAVMERVGAAAFFQGLDRWYQGFVSRGALDGMKLEIGSGVEGTNGLEDGWTRLCEQRLSSDVGLAFKL